MSIFDYLYPKFCLGCGKFGTYCCSRCVENIPKLQFLKCPVCGRPSIDGYTHIRCKKRFEIDGLLSLYPYVGVVKRAIKQMKYRFAFRVLGDVLQQVSVNQLMCWKKRMGYANIVVVPIPLHVSRLHFRGFNQSDSIATYIANQLNVQVTRNVLIRKKKTVPQVDMMSRGERLNNMKHVFEVVYTHQLGHNPVILLIDDVFTTGATMRSAASVLKKHGVKTVWGLTIAQ